MGYTDSIACARHVHVGRSVLEVLLPSRFAQGSLSSQPLPQKTPNKNRFEIAAPLWNSALRPASCVRAPCPHSWNERIPKYNQLVPEWF